MGKEKQMYGVETLSEGEREEMRCGVKGPGTKVLERDKQNE